MHITNQGLLARFDTFVKNLSPSDVLALFHDADSDGISSGAIVATAIKRLRGRIPDVRIYPAGASHTIREEDVALMKKAGVTKLISCDVALDNMPDITERIASFAEILIIDHHALYHPFKAKNIILIKPQLFTDLAQPSRYCTSKLAYDLFSRHVNLEDKDWLAAAGCISDIATEPWQAWIKSVFKKYKVPLQKDLFKTAIGKVGIYINDTASYDTKEIHKAFNAAIEATTYKDLLNSPIKRYHNIIEEDIIKWTKHIKTKGEWHPELKLVFYKVTPKYSVKSAITTILGLKYKQWILAVCAPEHGKMTISMRCNDQHVAVNKLIVEGLKDLPDASGGGHIPAAGGRCNVKDYPTFKDNVMRLLREGFTGLEK
jgi:hypothetical protein